MSSLELPSLPIEHFENKIIVHFENEVGLGVLQSRTQLLYNLQKFYVAPTESIHNQVHAVCVFGILAAFAFVKS